jgi:preprotein translocase subunit YajC
MIATLAQSTTTTSGGGLSVLALPVILIGAFYFLMIRPQKRQRAQQQALLNSLEVGDDVMTSGGIFGTIVDIDEDDDVVTVEIAPGTRIRMVRAGIGRKIVEQDLDDEDDGEDADEDEGADETT